MAQDRSDASSKGGQAVSQDRQSTSATGWNGGESRGGSQPQQGGSNRQGGSQQGGGQQVAGSQQRGAPQQGGSPQPSGGSRETPQNGKPGRKNQ